MVTQLAFDFTIPPAQPLHITKSNDSWIDVRDIAAGVGFTGPVQLSTALDDSLKHRRDETGLDYDQRLYDLLWLANFRLALDHASSVTFNFTFQWNDGETEKTSNMLLRVRVQLGDEVTLIDLAHDL